MLLAEDIAVSLKRDVDAQRMAHAEYAFEMLWWRFILRIPWTARAQSLRTYGTQFKECTVSVFNLHATRSTLLWSRST